MLEIKTQVGVSERALEEVQVAFGLLQCATRPDGSGVTTAVTAPPASGGCENG